MNTVVITCKTISHELNKVIDETSYKYPVLWIESGLHLDTQALRKYIQEKLEIKLLSF